jgi:hypothetical protein
MSTEKSPHDKKIFYRVLVSRFISGVGDWGGLIAISNMAYMSSQSTVDLSLIYAFKILAIVVSSKVQKILLRRAPSGLSTGTMLGYLEFLSAVSIVPILLIQTQSSSHLALFYFFSAMCNAIFLALSNTLITNLFPEQYKAHLQSVVLSKRIAFLLGPIVMGATVALYGNTAGILFDIVSFLLSGLILFRIPIPISKLIDESEGSITTSTTKSPLQFDFFKSHSWLVIVLCLVGVAGGNINAIELPFIVNHLGLGPQFFGMSLAICGLGSVVGLLLEKKIPSNFSYKFLITTSICGLILSMAPWYLKTTVWFSIGLFFFGIFITIFANKMLFSFVDLYNSSAKTKSYFENKPAMFIFVHQLESISMIFGLLISGMVAHYFTIFTSLNFAMTSLLLAALANTFGNWSIKEAPPI